MPEGMGVILRTAGANRTKTEIKRDFEYLLRLWETVRDLTLKSTAPMLVYEEGSLIKRSIRDLYGKDIDEILVAGDEGYHEAKDFMRMLMPSHAKNVKPYEDALPIFSRFGVENQLDAMFYAGRAIALRRLHRDQPDRSARRHQRQFRPRHAQHHIEDTALKTNLEAADEIARQLRLRDLAGLIVIDFIDMDEKRNNRTVERRLKEASSRTARASRSAISRISGYWKCRASASGRACWKARPTNVRLCGGSGHVRSVSSVSLQLLRALEETLHKGATHNIIVRTRAEVAFYVLNHKRSHLRALEERFRITITINADDTVTAPQSFVIDRGEQVHSLEQAKAIGACSRRPPSPPSTRTRTRTTSRRRTQPNSEDRFTAVSEEEAGPEGEPEQDQGQEQGAEGGQGRKRRRRRRGRRGEGREAAEPERDGGAVAPEHAPAFAPQAGENDLSQAEEGHENGNALTAAETPES